MGCGVNVGLQSKEKGNWWKIMPGVGFEPANSASLEQRSNQLSQPDLAVRWT